MVIIIPAKSVHVQDKTEHSLDYKQAVSLELEWNLWYFLHKIQPMFSLLKLHTERNFFT